MIIYVTLPACGHHVVTVDSNEINLYSRRSPLVEYILSVLFALYVNILDTECGAILFKEKADAIKAHVSLKVPHLSRSILSDRSVFTFYLLKSLECIFSKNKIKQVGRGRRSGARLAGGTGA